MTSERATVSAVVTTRNEAANIVRCLASVRAQTIPVELIVVDNGSTDGTAELAAPFADVVLQHGPERSSQRNAGAEIASGEYLLFLDADMELAPNVVEECLQVASAGADAVTIPERSVGDGLWSAAKALERACYLGDDSIEAPRFFTRASFDRHGGYDEKLTGPEDWDLPARMRVSERVGRVRAEITHHEGRLTIAGLARKKFYYGKSFAAYARRHPQLMRRQVVRIAFFREWRRLAAQPGLAAVMVFMKTIEYASGGAGFLHAAMAERLSHGPRVQ